MSTWAERVHSHPVHQALRSTQSAVESVDPKHAQTESALPEFDRLLQVVAFARRVVEGADPNLCPQAPLDAMNSSLAQVQQEVANFASNPAQPVYLQRAQAHADSVVQTALTLPVVRDEGDATGVRDAVTRLRMSVSQHLRNVGEEVAALQTATADGGAKARALAAEIEKQTGRLDTAIATFQQQFSTAQDTRSGEFTQAEKTRAAEAAEAERRRAAEHAEATKERATAADELIATAHAATQAALAVDRQAFQGALADAQAARQRAEGALAEQSREHLEALADFRRQAEALVGVIGQTGMISGYQRVADEERLAARVWLGLATVALLGLVASAGWIAHLPFSATGFRWEAAGTRAFLALACLALAGFAARQAGQHQQVERRNRQMELELASVGPFLQQLPDADRHALLKEIADRTFARSPAVLPSPEAPVKFPAAEAFGAIKTVAELAGGKK